MNRRENEKLFKCKYTTFGFLYITTFGLCIYCEREKELEGTFVAWQMIFLVVPLDVIKSHCGFAKIC